MSATHAKSARRQQSPTTRFEAHDRRILVLQGGGALGAYQAGVYEGLSATGFAPNWVAGVSIGAINSALIAGNPPEHRLDRLREFWNRVSAQAPFILPAGLDVMRPAMNRMAAASAMTFGIPGFFQPRPIHPYLAPEGSLAALSFYDTTPLRDTLEELVDFDRVNEGEVRLSLGSVNVRSGDSHYFDSTRDRIGAAHVMASGALPPGFPPVEIDGEFYWDGGIMSNTPLQYVLEDFRMNALVVQVDLFSGRGELPQTLDQAQERAKDIQYRSKQRLSHARIRELEALRATLADVIGRLPKSMQADPQVRKLAEVSQRGPLSLLHLVNRHDTRSSDFKDYEFSRATVDDLWDAGRDDVARMLTDPQACVTTDFGNGVRAYDFQ
ncbi:MAG: patatin-like phospholipase family protein [Burkholderiales bacterium]